MNERGGAVKISVRFWGLFIRPFTENKEGQLLLRCSFWMHLLNSRGLWEIIVEVISQLLETWRRGLEHSLILRCFWTKCRGLERINVSCLIEWIFINDEINCWRGSDTYYFTLYISCLGRNYDIVIKDGSLKIFEFLAAYMLKN